MVAPVMLFTYSRPDHTLETIRALEKNSLAGETEVFAYVCAPKNHGIAERVGAVRDLLRSYEGSPSFKRFSVIEREAYMPLGPAMVDAVSTVLGERDEIIVLEDDIVTSRDFLDFMNDALDFYRGSQDVFSVTGYSFGMKEIRELGADVYMVNRVCPWGWATWKDRWELYRHDPRREYASERNDRRRRREMLAWSRDLPITMDALIFGENAMDGNWEQQMCYRQFKTGMGTICPKVSKVKNIGFEGGTHDSPVGLDPFYEEAGCPYELTHPVSDPAFQKKYSMKFIFGAKHRIMHHLSETLFKVSPRLHGRVARRHFGRKTGGK